MGKKDKNSVPEYQPAKFDTGNLFGSSTTNKSGTTYQAPDWISDTVGTVANNVNPTLNSMLSNDYSNDANFQVYQDNFNRGMQQAYDTNVLGNLANRGLMRSSGLQAATNSFNNTMQQGLADLYDNYYNRQSNNLANLLNTSNTLYDYITGVANSSRQDANAINNYNLAKYRLENSSSGSGIGNLIGSIGNIAGAYNSFKGGS